MQGTLPVGLKYDGEKERYDLLPDVAVNLVVKVLTYGAKKYRPGNWALVQGWRERYYSALQRHLYAWRTGEKNDSESGLPHLAHACCCLLYLLALDHDNKTAADKAKDTETT